MRSLQYLTQDLIISARTGEGKTLCFLIPIIQQLISWCEKGKIKRPNHIQALIVTPTRELAVQIKEHCEKIVPHKYRKDKRFKVCLLLGNMSMEKQERELNDRPAIVIGTPG